MARVLDGELLDRCDEIIGKYSLHSGPMLGPVEVEALLEAYGREYRYDVLPRGVDGFLMRWRRAGREFVVMMLDERLREIEQSARRRYVVAHELAHLVCGHRGSEWVLRRVRGEVWAVQLGFGEWLDAKQERESDVVAAYLLVPMPTLREMKGMDRAYMARILDVPERVVELRWEIWRKRGR